MTYKIINKKGDVRVASDFSDIGIKLGDKRFSVRQLIENYYYIIDKAGERVLLKFNQAQQIVYKIVCKRLYMRKRCAFVILKARQHGITTLIEALGHVFTMFRGNQSCVIIANTTENANKIFAKMDYFQKNLPNELKRALVSKTGNQMVTENSPSSIRVAPATTDAVRGTTLTFFEGSEVAFWDDQNGVLSSVLGAMPSVEINPVTFIFLESTAHGFNEFKDLWDESCSVPENQAIYVPIFLPRFINDEYRALEPLDERSLTPFEKEKMEKHHLDLYQMAFWRNKFIEFKQNRPLTLQEFPFDPNDCFISTGSGVFNSEFVEKRKVVVRDIPYLTGFMRHNLTAIDGDIDRLVMSNVEFVESEIGILKVWEKPIDGVPYVVGVDMAVGLGNDNSAVFVYRNDTKKQVASMTCNSLPADVFSYDVMALTYWYNNALIAPEVNYGTTLIRIIKKLDYENVYQREVDETANYEGFIENLGIKTTQRNKAAMVDNFRAICEDDKEPYSNIMDYALLTEMLTFIYDYGKGVNAGQSVKIKGAGKNHDDRVMAAVLAYYASEQQTTIVKVKGKPSVDNRYQAWLFDEEKQEDKGKFRNYFL